MIDRGSNFNEGSELPENEPLFWDEAWNAKTYAWPVTPLPNTDVVHELGAWITSSGGHHLEEAHADRAVMIEAPNPAVPGTKVRKKVPRCECRRRALLTLPPVRRPGKRANDGPIRVCAVCDAVPLWPQYAA